MSNDLMQIKEDAEVSRGARSIEVLYKWQNLRVQIKMCHLQGPCVE